MAETTTETTTGTTIESTTEANEGRCAGSRKNIVSASALSLTYFHACVTVASDINWYPHE